MPYYLAPYEKVPVRDTEQCQPVGCEGKVQGPIDLRADGGATLEGGGLNACLLWLPRRSRDWRLTLLAESPHERLARSTRRYLESLLWVSNLPGHTFADTVLRLMLNPPRHGWRAIRPSRAGVYEVWLGGQRLAALRAIRGGTTITESFDKADNGLGPDLTWTVFSGSNLGVLTNTAKQSAAGEAMARADADLATDDHYAQVETGPAYTDGVVGVICRKDASATVTCYRWSNFGIVGGWELVKFVGGTETPLDTTYTTDPVAEETFKISADGSTIKGYHTAGTERASVTDPTPITGNLRCGIHVGNFASVDNFEAGDLGAAGPTAGEIAVASQAYTRLPVVPTSLMRASGMHAGARRPEVVR